MRSWLRKGALGLHQGPAKESPVYRGINKRWTITLEAFTLFQVCLGAWRTIDLAFRGANGVPVYQLHAKWCQVIVETPVSWRTAMKPLGMFQFIRKSTSTSDWPDIFRLQATRAGKPRVAYPTIKHLLFHIFAL